MNVYHVSSFFSDLSVSKRRPSTSKMAVSYSCNCWNCRNRQKNVGGCFIGTTIRFTQYCLSISFRGFNRKTWYYVTSCLVSKVKSAPKRMRFRTVEAVKGKTARVMTRSQKKTSSTICKIEKEGVVIEQEYIFKEQYLNMYAYLNMNAFKINSFIASPLLFYSQISWVYWKRNFHVLWTMCQLRLNMINQRKRTQLPLLSKWKYLYWNIAILRFWTDELMKMFFFIKKRLRRKL